MRNKTLLVLLFSLAVASLTTVGVLRGQSQRISNTKQETATPVQEGVMSETQKKHSKLYGSYKGTVKLQLLIRQEANASDELTVTVLPGLPELEPRGENTTAASVLRNLAAQADAVLIATVKDKTSQLTEDGTFVFTDYKLKTEEVLKDNRSAHIEPQASVTVTRPGGKISLNGRTVKVIDKSFKPMSIGGRYLIFLKYIAETGAYQAINDKASFELIDNSVLPLTEAPADSRNDRDAESFIADVRTVIAALSQSSKGENK